MWISSLELTNVRAYKELHMEFSPNVNIIIGPNNSGKSTILHVLSLLQPNRHNNQIYGGPLNRLKTLDSDFKIEITLNNKISFSANQSDKMDEGKYQYDKKKRQWVLQEKNKKRFQGFINTHSDGIIVPFFSKRKHANISNAIGEKAKNEIKGNFENIVARLVEVTDYGNPERQSAFFEGCENILGLKIISRQVGEGMMVGYSCGDDFIPISSLGEGVTNVIGMLADMLLSKDKVFIIEEPENDLHPASLKSLLDILGKCSSNNQFIITTHSHIVVSKLAGSYKSKIFEVQTDFDENMIPLSTVETADDTIDARRSVMENLGYDFSDWGHWAGYLFLEEASAQIMFEDFLIPTFFPKLKGKLKIISSGGESKVKRKFDDFNSHFVFCHLDQVYKNKAWVFIDAGENENETLTKLKSMYVEQNEWNESCFQQFDKHCFEDYYPPIDHIENLITEIKDISKANRKQCGAKKCDLAREVIKWCKENPNEAYAHFSEHARNVIEKLSEIDKDL